MKKIEQALQRQLELNQTKNMLYAQLDQIIEIDLDFLAALEELLPRGPASFPEPGLEAAISSASRMLLQRLYAINQFLHIDEPKRQQLERIYRRTWRRIVETQNIQATLNDYHYPALTKWIARL